MTNSLSPQTIEYLKAWMMSAEHIQNPYPTEEEKADIIRATGIEKKQLTCWFSNNRKRFWKPEMDKLRAKHGLSEDDPLPADLLASITVAAPTAFAHADGANRAKVAEESVAAIAPLASLPVEDIHAASLPLEPLEDTHHAPSLPMEDFSHNLQEDDDAQHEEEPSDEVVAV